MTVLARNLRNTSIGSYINGIHTPIITKFIDVGTDLFDPDAYLRVLYTRFGTAFVRQEFNCRFYFHACSDHGLAGWLFGAKI